MVSILYRSRILTFGFLTTMLLSLSAFDLEQVNWFTTPSSHRGENGKRFTYLCPPIQALPSSAGWGTDVYTDDSGICAAAVHAGKIKATGGLVEIEIRPGEASYTGSARNGIETSDFGSWPGSFVFTRSVGAPPPIAVHSDVGKVPLTSAAGFPSDRTVDDPAANAIDGNVNTLTWTTEPFNVESPSYLEVSFVGRPVERISLWKLSTGGGGANSKNLTIEFTTDTGPLASRTWQPVTGLKNGFNGTELLKATAVNEDGTVTGDTHDSPGGDGWASLTFDSVSATGIRIGFSNTTISGPCTGLTAEGACNHYRVGEFEVY